VGIPNLGRHFWKIHTPAVQSILGFSLRQFNRFIFAIRFYGEDIKTNCSTEQQKQAILGSSWFMVFVVILSF
jgi:hypothetical protein